MGAETYKLKFGHRGANHPVKELETGKVEITSQNHGFAVDPTVAAVDVKVTHVNLNDQHDRRPAARDEAGLLRAVSSRSGAGSARRRLPVPAVPGRNGTPR